MGGDFVGGEMFGGEVTMYLPVQQHSLVARCATYICISRFTISIFSPFHNVPTPPFYHGYNYKISTHILCIKQCFCEHPAIHVICFYTKDVFRFQAIARLQELSQARKSLTPATGYDVNPKVSLS